METENKENILIYAPQGHKTSNASKTSLQENFEKFRKQKQINVKKVNAQNRKTPEFKAILRNKFIQQAKKYFGVPYAARYWKQGEEHYNAPLYLDCCALTRRVMLDLAEDFGFVIGRWNQCYQYDTLPIDLKFEQLKPGDLIFYSATYYNDKWKSQKHNMVHVQIFIGGETGQATIGARWQRGVVQVFNSYKFNSTAYYDIKFHYKSIDTWLEGVCKSWCPEHNWKIASLQWLPDKKSIFSTDNGQECYEDQDDLFAPAAGEDEESANIMQQEKKVNSDCQNTFLIGEGNGQEYLKNVLASPPFQWKAIQSADQMTDKFKLKWTQLSNNINYISFKEGKQMVNHIPNSNLLIGKNMLHERIQDLVYLIKDEYFKPLQEQKVDISEFWLTTFRLDSAMKRADFYKFVKDNSTDDQKWWLRRAISNWTGVKFIDNLGQLSNDIAAAYKQQTEANDVEKKDEEMLEQKEKQLKKLKQYSIIHRVPTKLFLLQNKRCDMRAYMLIASTKPKYSVLLSKEVQFKLSFEQYDSELNQQFAQITNYYIQKKCNKSKDKFDQYNPTFNRVYQQAQKSLNYSESQAQFRSLLLDSVKRVMRNVFETVRSRFQRKAGFFQLFAFDFALEVKQNNSLNPVLMDVISNPRIQFDTIEAERIVRALIPQALEVVIDINEQKENNANSKINQSFLVVYSE